jgi:glc operon protein GlcG
MRFRLMPALACTALLTFAGQVAAQTAAPVNPLDAIPEKMPFAQPYGAPIGLEKAQAAIAAAVAEAAKKGWPMNVAVYDSGANLVAFARMDGSQIGSIAIAEHKARASVKFRRESRAFEDAVQLRGFNYILSIDDAIASRGGIPLVEDGKIIGAIGCSGATGSQDEAICKVGAATVNK